MDACLDYTLTAHSIVFFMNVIQLLLHFFFFNDTATTEIYTLSLHDALPISLGSAPVFRGQSPYENHAPSSDTGGRPARCRADRKSTRLNSSHLVISYAVFCLKKKKNKKKQRV